MTDYERSADLSDRAATGELLPEKDREFVEQFAEVNELARAEAALWQRMANLDGVEDETRSLRIADRAVEIASRGKRARAGRAWAWAVGAVAAAAAGALFISGRGTGGNHTGALLV